jgi:putative glycosyltransferase (TIGR04348 family)
LGWFSDLQGAGQEVNIGLITPAPEGSRFGNRISALRWARLLGELGHKASIETQYSGENWQLLIVLHAGKSHAALRDFREKHPKRPTFVVLTGTDVYGDLDLAQNKAHLSIEWADKVLVLQSLAKGKLPAAIQTKTVVVRQSALAPKELLPIRDDAFEVSVIGHLRAVKDPFLTARASRLLEPSSEIVVSHLGSAYTEQLEQTARSEMAENSRYQWLGDCSHEKTMQILQRSRLMVLSSLSEGGANVISEALVCDTPVLSTAMDGSIGLLGMDYPGYYPVGDARELARLLTKFERDADYRQRLKRRCQELRELFDPASEREIWRQLMTTVSA